MINTFSSTKTAHYASARKRSTTSPPSTEKSVNYVLLPINGSISHANLAWLPDHGASTTSAFVRNPSYGTPILANANAQKENTDNSKSANVSANLLS